MEASTLAEKLWKDADYLAAMGGGVTFSGGEPFGQSGFLLECLIQLRGMHRAIETSGFCEPEIFCRILSELDYIIMDLKIMDEELHKRYTGVSNRLILENLEQVKRSRKPFRIRIPVIPGVNDTRENYLAAAEVLKGAENLEKVELLPYHRTAGAKYPMVGRDYSPSFDPEQAPVLCKDIFLERGIPCESL